MQIISAASDGAILAEIGARIARARLERDWTQEHVARRASVGVNTLRRLERGEGATLTNLIRVLRALDLLDGLETALPVPAPSPIQRLRLAGRPRRRASGGHRGAGAPDPSAPWEWGDEAPG